MNDGPDVAEMARFLHRMVDLWEQGTIWNFEWSERLERVVPSQRREHQDDYTRYPSCTNGELEPVPKRAYVTWTHDAGYEHPFVMVADELERAVRSARTVWKNKRKEREQEAKALQLLRDWHTRGMMRKEAARRAGTSPSAASKRVKKMLAEAPTGPKRERWLRDHGCLAQGPVQKEMDV